MRKRSRYRPRGVILDTMAWVKSGMKRVAELEGIALTLKIKNHNALANLVQGRGGRDDIDILIAAFNMTEALARIRPELGADWSVEIRAAQDALLSMAQRGVERGRFLFTGPEMQAINLGMELHDAQLERCTVKEVERGLDLVNQEILNKRARTVI